MKKLFFIFSVLSFIQIHSQNRKIPVDTMVVTNHSTTINGIGMNYSATTGTQPVWNSDGEPMATLFYTYYQRSNVKDKANRPLVISFNGGPGSASVWMHVAYTGPQILKIDDEGYPVQPYGVKTNPYSILDVADIVFVNPVNTGYSRMVEDKDGKLPNRKNFFGINADISYLAEWINTFVTRHNRWESPKYLIGESYGGPRVMGLAEELQNNQWMYLNGVILVSPADYKIYSTDQPIYSALNLPYFTAAAWHQKALAPALQQKDLSEILPEVEAYAIDKLMPAIAKGGFISEAERNAVAEKMSLYSGLSQSSILDHNLNIPTSFFWKELLRDRGYTIGRLDSRYLGIDKMAAGNSPDYNAELSSWLHSFTPAINYYLREHLDFKTDVKYNMFGDVHPWDRQHDNTRDRLRQAMAQNPYLKVLVQSGYYDGATTYFAAKYTVGQLDPSGTMKDRFIFKAYRSGHMMYLRKEDLKSSNDDIRDFIKNSLSNGKSAKY
ncbi:S10 family peptidase [Bizionia hallyeonensis]|uniref:S10 family peptidase n=1 Tax=Bizionia hallyeonensis TaxID=1123757 RepID=A0ABW0C498_9FLAO